MMDHSPIRELRNRVKVSPSTSPSTSSLRLTPNSSPIQAVKFSTNYLNGTTKNRSPTKSNMNKVDSNVNVSSCQNIMAFNPENDCLTNKTSAASNIDFPKESTSFQKALMDNLSINTITMPGAVPNSHLIMSLDINSNMNPDSNNEISVLSNGVAGAISKRSRKQSSPKRARTASTSPVCRESLPSPLWQDILEQTPRQPKKCPRKISYIAIGDSPALDVIDLTVEVKTPENTRNEKHASNKFSNPMSYNSKPSQKTYSKVDVLTPSPARCQSPRACKSVEKNTNQSSCPKFSTKMIEKEGGFNGRRSIYLNAMSKSPNKLNSYESVRGKRTYSMRVIDSPRNRSLNSCDSPKSKRQKTATKDSPSSCLRSPVTRITSPGKGRPRKILQCSDSQSSAVEGKQKKVEPSEEKNKNIKLECHDQDKFILKESCPSKSVETTPGNVLKKILPACKKLEKDNTNLAGDKNDYSVSDNLKIIQKDSVNDVFINNHSPLEASESSSKMTKQSPVKGRFPLRLKTESPVKLKLESATPTDVNSAADLLLNDELLHADNVSNVEMEEKRSKRRMVRPKRNMNRQRKTSGARGRQSTGRKKKIVTSPCKFQINQEVLARWYDGLFYLGSVIKVDERGRKCYVKFEDDSEYWILFKDLQKGAKEGDVSCCLCQTDTSDKPNEIVLCDNCGLGYHQECHNPNIPNDVLQPDVEWCCRLCVFAAAVKKGGALKNGPDAKALQKMKQTFPYNINKLTWDAQHKTNVEQSYCYCGGPGNWFLKMLQCCRCRQWFHEACIQCLEYPLMNGDRFYLFVCSHCNMGPEYIKRLDLKWADVVHLTLYNLTIEGRWNKFYDVVAITEFITSNWEMLQVDCLTVEKDFVRENVVSTLERYKSRFMNQRETKKKAAVKQSYGLRVRIPPPAPTVMLPHTGQVNHEIMMSLKEKGKNFKCFVPTQCNSPVPMPWQHKQRGLEMDVSIAFKSDKIRKNLMQTVENSQNSGYRSEDTMFCHRSLDTLIPVLHNYEGFNHPFKNFFEQEEELAHCKRKNEIMNYLYVNYESDTMSHSSVDSFSMNKDDPTKAIPTPPPSVTSGSNAQGPSKSIKTRGCKRKAEANLSELSRHNKRKRVTTSFYNVVDTQCIEEVKYTPINMNQIRNNMCQYFGVANKLKKGEKYNVIGKHVTSDGKIKYLIQWDGLQTK